jgi:hypothetical protein
MLMRLSTGPEMRFRYMVTAPEEYVQPSTLSLK